MYADEPSVATRVIRAKLRLELTKLGIGELVSRHLVRAHNLAQHIDLAETNLTDHVDEFAKFNLAIAARVDLLDELGHLLWRQILVEMFERNGDLGSVNTARTKATKKR